MIYYTIGIVFCDAFNRVLLIKKNRPDWQKGKLNCPGGKVQPGESTLQCVAREFKEETSYDISEEQWIRVGALQGDGYEVMMFTANLPGNISLDQPSPTDEEIQWYFVNYLPHNIISNLRWIVPLAKNFHMQGLNGQDKLIYSQFHYAR